MPDPETHGRAAEIVGRFRLVRLLGEGGMGSVYLGERTGDFKQTVAVKLLREGLCDPSALLRFGIERRALASLQHPNIVQLIDGGLTGDGIPFLVMDYVEGMPLDRYCDERQALLRERIRLMIQVLEAVDHAHRHFVAHCDLKFSNILVSAEGQPRLLDFGLTKLLEPARSRLDPQATRVAPRPFTLEFASPEQLQGEDLTTATDLYSCGVMLYSLVTGTHPFEALRDQPLALLHATLSAEPEEPSHRLSRQARTEPTIARRLAATRGTTPARLAGELRGDLDSIVLRALRKEPNHRYSSAAQFAADLRNVLAGRPVESRRGSRRYRAWKFVRRNRAGVIAAAILVVALLAGAAGAVSQAIRAQRSRAIAEARFDDARRLTDSLLVDFYAAVQKLDGSEAAQKALVQWSRETLESLARHSAGNPRVNVELAITYLRLGELQAAGARDLAHWTAAIASFDQGLKLLPPVLGKEAADQQALLTRTKLLEGRSRARARIAGTQ